MAKATFWTVTDTEVRKRGEQTGLDTLVVHAVNDEYWLSGPIVDWATPAKALSIPPGEYAGNGETQRN